LAAKEVMDYYSIWQQSTYGNILPSTPLTEAETDDTRMVEYFETLKQMEDEQS
jgi:hypothetical protein